MVARELQHAPRDPLGLLRGLPEPWVISETGVRGCLPPTPLAECLAELPCFCSARRTPKFWQRVPVGDRNSRGLVLLRVGFGQKTEKRKNPQRPAGEWLCSPQATFSYGSLDAELQL